MTAEFTIHNVDAEDDQLELSMLDRLIIRDRNFKDAFDNEYTVKLSYHFDEPSFKTFIKGQLEGHDDIDVEVEIGMEPLARAVRDAIFRPEIDLETHQNIVSVIQEAYEKTVDRALVYLDLLPVGTAVAPVFGQVLQSGVPVAIIQTVELESKDCPTAEVSIYPATALDSYTEGEELETQIIIGSHYLNGKVTSINSQEKVHIFEYKDGYNKEATPIKPPIDTTLVGEPLDQARLDYLNSFKQFNLDAPEIDDDLLEDLL